MVCRIPMGLEVPGVTKVTLLQGDRPLHGDRGGRIAHFDSGAPVLLTVDIEPSARIVAFCSHVDRSVALKGRANCDGHPRYEYELGIPRFGLRPFENRIRLMYIEDGLLKIADFGAILQNRSMYLVAAGRYRLPVCRDAQKVVHCPFLQEGSKAWPQLMAMIQEVAQKALITNWPLVPGEEPLCVVSDPADFGRDHGVVEWYDPFRGMGAVRIVGGSARVYWKEICVRREPVFLQQGEVVHFDEAQDDDKKGGSLPLSLHGVTVVR